MLAPVFSSMVVSFRHAELLTQVKGLVHFDKLALECELASHSTSVGLENAYAATAY